MSDILMIVWLVAGVVCVISLTAAETGKRNRLLERNGWLVAIGTVGCLMASALMI